VFVALALIVRTPLEGVFSLGTPHGFYAEFFPHWLLIGFYTLFTGLAFLVAAAGIVRFWRALKAADDASGNRERVVGIIPAVIHTLKSLLVHDKFAKCVSHSSRRLAHLMVFYGFVALFLVTVWAVFDMYVKPYIGWETVYPFDLAHPMKFLGNAGALLLVIGCLYVIRNRMGSVKEVGSSTSFDWIFVLLLLSVGVTGILTEALRFVAAPGGHAAAANARTGLEYTALAVYFVHLVLVFELLVFLPYSKFAHLLYRTTAQVYAEHSGRNLTARELALSKQDARSPTGVHSESDEESQAKESLGVLSPRTSEART